MTQIESAGDSAPPYSFQTSPGFTEWLHEQKIGLALTTYQIGKLFLIGAASADRLSVTERTFQRCLGVAAFGTSLYLAGLNNIMRFDNVVPEGNDLEGHDAVYVPQVAWYTADLFAHDVGVTSSGRPIFVNTMFSCLATVEEGASFRPVWQPPFVSKLQPGDVCHLNGLAMDNGRPRFVTAAGTTDEPGSWRQDRIGGGCVIDVHDNEIVARGLTMPHSPRVFDGKLYICNAGTGELGTVDLNSGRFEPIVWCPGFTRGLALVNGYALMGLSLPRQHRDFSGMPLDDRLKAAGQEAECALYVIDLARGETVHWLRIGGVVREFYDVALLPHVKRPMVVGLGNGGQINRLITRGRPLSMTELLSEPAVA